MRGARAQGWRLRAQLGLTRGVCSPHPEQGLGNGDPASESRQPRVRRKHLFVFRAGAGEGLPSEPHMGGGGEDAGVFTWAACGRQGGRV